MSRWRSISDGSSGWEDSGERFELVSRAYLQTQCPASAGPTTAGQGKLILVRGGFGPALRKAADSSLSQPRLTHSGLPVQVLTRCTVMLTDVSSSVDASRLLQPGGQCRVVVSPRPAGAGDDDARSASQPMPERVGAQACTVPNRRRGINYWNERCGGGGRSSRAVEIATGQIYPGDAPTESASDPVFPLPPSTVPHFPLIPPPAYT